MSQFIFSVFPISPVWRESLNLGNISIDDRKRKPGRIDEKVKFVERRLGKELKK